ncbi:FAM65A [Branchiostoma lanceolatum]|uniref:FAM65A protein n=1 Tax=Branchiostoma lanceolatum TaxID=7740 RepID=A0A8J9VAE2_BRALA|nr:FAM65A [Branchiostoma lanceolatum]
MGSGPSKKSSPAHPPRSQAVQNNENEKRTQSLTVMPLQRQAVQNNENERLVGLDHLVMQPQAIQNNENEKLEVMPIQAVQNNQNEKREDDTTKQGGQTALRRLDSSSEFGQDVMISYSHQDMDFMRKMRGSLEAAGISVWVDEQGLGAGVDFLNKIGHAIVEAKVFLSLLSPISVTSKYCKDELALAYISNKPIFPVAMATRDSLRKDMDFGMQLTLAPMEWVDFSDRGSFDISFTALTQKIKAATKPESEVAEVTRPNLERPPTRQNLNKMTRLNSNPLDDESDFWERAFKNAKDVPWLKFTEAFDKTYGSLLDGMLISSGSEHKDWLMTVLKREMTVENNVLTRENYDEFRHVGGVKLPFWQRVHEQAVESYTMREVFQMESSVRLSAIEDLAKYRSKAVVDALLDLLNDSDPNVRAVAAVTLAKSGNAEDQEVINRLLKTLQDKDRLVRESGCIALGYLRASKAVPQLVHLWRNDTISTVREAASVSLEKIGGEEAEKAIHMTKVLSEEIKLLMQQSMQKQA